MTQLTETKENIKILNRLVRSERYILRQLKAAKRRNMSKK